MISSLFALVPLVAALTSILSTRHRLFTASCQCGVNTSPGTRNSDEENFMVHGMRSETLATFDALMPIQDSGPRAVYQVLRNPFHLKLAQHLEEPLKTMRNDMIKIL